MSNNNFLDVDAVADFMGTSNSTAYRIIKKLNNELKSNGYVTVAGKINRKYFESKIYGQKITSLNSVEANYVSL